ncbi:helix-turn-helix domain-containing protein [Fusobacterium polymorphum]|uniref:helix-turn-helix domain-containing protein n=1 Tax=Fusobacterium nucleatum subsp. polymorphum TaxID=76857 RepID=UPI002062AE01|nr:LexA family transcriptional regulator [Fusobacterium polymorphum]WRL75722.1 LexA family transcriptional regulator [Fusobacterium polymorphum]DAR72658.1 MAG TPA: Repressor protein CI [Caudoviricetes sp.]
MDMYDRIRNRRKELKMTQDELAKLTGYNDRSSIAKIEAKKADLSQSKIIAFAEALKVSTSYLMDGEVKEIEEKSNINMNDIETDFMMIPLYESISAGYGASNSEFIKMIPVFGLKKNGTTYFAVKVEGDSMEPKIPNGSTIIIKKDIAIEVGEIGAFNLNDENFVKQKKLVKDKLILHSFNLAYEDKVVNEFDDFIEYGKVVKVMIDL